MMTFNIQVEQINNIAKSNAVKCTVMQDEYSSFIRLRGITGNLTFVEIEINNILEEDMNVKRRNVQGSNQTELK